MTSATCLLIAASLIVRVPDAPIRRPPNSHDELCDGRDYYPDALLEEYRRSGVNGVWLLVEPAALATNEAALAKLERVTATCARHGIGVWPLMIETQVGRVICPSDTNDLAFVRQSVGAVFRRVPALRGLIALTLGERESTCLLRERCPRCAGHAAARHADYVRAILDGARSGRPDAGLIDWFYHPDANPARGRPAWLADAIRALPPDVIVQSNFESGLLVDQLGKIRKGGDYWLSQIGPSGPFRLVAEAARASGHRLSAKIQMSCSHELATLPYVPVPGLLYRKFKAMKEEGVADAQLCWFFGGSPGLMLRATGLLSTWDFRRDEDTFLSELAAREGLTDEALSARVTAWRRLADGYADYPVSNMFQYYGPVHAGVVWPLLTDISLAPLPRSWKPQDTPHGDLIGEALENHTLDEACALLRSAVGKMDGAAYDDLSHAFVLQFRIASDVLEFYRLRREAVCFGRSGEAEKARSVLERMRSLVVRTCADSRALRELAVRNPTFGYHPESEDRRYDPAKIDARLASLEETDRRLKEIADGLTSTGYPLSSRERLATTFKDARFAEGGALEIDTPVPDPERTVGVWLYDVCGTEHALSYKTRPQDGRLRLRIPASDWGDDEARRPGWILIRQQKWSFPSDPDLWERESRLGLWHLDGVSFARIGFENKGEVK